MGVMDDYLTQKSEAESWRPIKTLEPSDDLILAASPPDKMFPSGRVMIWKASFLVRNIKGPTPDHISFPAIVWRPMVKTPWEK